MKSKKVHLLSRESLAYQAELQAKYLVLLSQAAEDAVRVEGLLWRNCFYKVIEGCRRQLRSYENDQLQGGSNGDKRSKIVSAYSSFLYQANSYYTRMIMDWKQAGAVVLSEHWEEAVNSSSPTAYPPSLPVKDPLLPHSTETARQVVYRLLIHLGDIERYMVQCLPATSPASWKQAHLSAISHYQCAALLCPDNGYAYNQLAVTCTLIQAVPCALLYYLLAWRAPEPFTTAEANLFALISSLRQDVASNPPTQHPGGGGGFYGYCALAAALLAQKKGLDECHPPLPPLKVLAKQALQPFIFFPSPSSQNEHAHEHAKTETETVMAILPVEGADESEVYANLLLGRDPCVLLLIPLLLLQLEVGIRQPWPKKAPAHQQVLVTLFLGGVDGYLPPLPPPPSQPLPLSQAVPPLRAGALAALLLAMPPWSEALAAFEAAMEVEPLPRGVQLLQALPQWLAQAEGWCEAAWEEQHLFHQQRSLLSGGPLLGIRQSCCPEVAVAIGAGLLERPLQTDCEAGRLLLNGVAASMEADGVGGNKNGNTAAASLEAAANMLRLQCLSLLQKRAASPASLSVPRPQLHDHLTPLQPPPPISTVSPISAGVNSHSGPLLYEEAKDNANANANAEEEAEEEEEEEDEVVFTGAVRERRVKVWSSDAVASSSSATSGPSSHVEENAPLPSFFEVWAPDSHFGGSGGGWDPMTGIHLADNNTNDTNDENDNNDNDANRWEQSRTRNPFLAHGSLTMPHPGWNGS